jgi:hypothetical protein
MSIQIQGTGGSIAEVDGSTYRALRVTQRPTDYGTRGIYRVALISEPMTADIVPNSDFFQMRWPITPQLALIWGLTIEGFSNDTTPFVPGVGYLGLFIARNWTVIGSVSGFTVSLLGSRQTLRSSMAKSQISPMRMCTGDYITNGNRVLDAQPVGQARFAIGSSTNTNFLQQVGLYGSGSMEDGGNNSPIVLSQNEGIVINGSVPASGLWQFGLSVLWSEVEAY